jgi:hypothetical protein
MMPSLACWFSGTALFLAGSFAFGITVGLVGIRTAVSNKFFLFFGIIAVILTAFAWWTAANNEETSATQKRQLMAIRESVEKLAKTTDMRLEDPNQILAAAAAKLLEQDKKISELQPRKLSSLVTAANGNQEAQSYAMEFVKVFKASGCESDLSLPIPGLRPDVIGIHIGVRNLQNIPEGALTLSKILSDAGIQFTVSQMTQDFLPEVPFVLVVGAKSY